MTVWETIQMMREGGVGKRVEPQLKDSIGSKNGVEPGFPVSSCRAEE